MSEVTADRVVAAPAPATVVRRFRKWIANPWAKARFLWVIAIGYAVWALVPVVIAIVYSFNDGKSQTSLQGFSLRWYLTDVNSVLKDETLRSALLQSFKLTILVVVIAVPFGVAFALALDRWRGRGTGSSNFLMLFSFITPELAIGVALFLFFSQLLRSIGTGFAAQVLGLSMFEMAYPVIIVRARLLSIGKEYEEAAMDLGASPLGSLRRVLLPLLSPAVLASFAVVFATAIDDFVIAQSLSTGQGTQTVPILIYSSARRSPLPSLNALATITLVVSTTVIALAFVVYRRATRRDRGQARSATDLIIPG
jgi:spermidine/putrescine transport system permease protein